MNRREILSRLFFSSESVKTLLTGRAVDADALPAAEENKADQTENSGHFFPADTVFPLPQEIISLSEKFTIDTTVRFPGTHTEISGAENNYAGVRLGMKDQPGQISISANNGIDVGITRNGYLMIGNAIGNKQVAETVLTVSVRLALTVIPQNSGKCFVKLKALDRSGNTLATLSAEQDAGIWQGAIALVSNCESFIQHIHQTLNRQA